MVAAFPVAKLGAILIKQIAKPLANVVKARAKTSPIFRNYICMPPAQFYHWCEVRMRMWSMNMGKPANIPKLNEARAIELGAELVGETVIFTIAAVILTAEYIRSTRKETAKEEERKQEMLRIHSELKELYFAKAKLETEVRELIRVLHVNVNVSKDSSFNPDNPNFDSIPEHHRSDAVAAENAGFFSSITNVVWDAMELIFPTSEEKVVEGSASAKNGNQATSPPPPRLPPPPPSPPASSGSASPNSSKSQDNNNSSSKESNSYPSTASATKPKG